MKNTKLRRFITAFIAVFTMLTLISSAVFFLLFLTLFQNWWGVIGCMFLISTSIGVEAVILMDEVEE